MTGGVAHLDMDDDGGYSPNGDMYSVHRRGKVILYR